MLLTPHILAGMLFGTFTDDYRLSPFLGLFSYIVLECIPHWDSDNFSKSWVKVVRYIDFCLAAIAFIMIIFLKQTSGNLSSNGIVFDIRYILGGLFGAIPYFVFNLGPLAFSTSPFFTWAKKAHSFFRYEDKSVWGVLIQVSVCIICLAIIFKLVDFPTWERLSREFY
jgi:hypothetical protein